jgi:hypothetical protein
MDRCLPDAIITRDTVLRKNLEKAKEALQEAYDDLRDYNESMAIQLNRQYSEYIGKHVNINVLTSIGDYDFSGIFMGFKCAVPWKSTVPMTFVKIVLMEPNRNGQPSVREVWTPNLDMLMLSTMEFSEKPLPSME